MSGILSGFLPIVMLAALASFNKLHQHAFFRSDQAEVLEVAAFSTPWRPLDSQLLKMKYWKLPPCQQSMQPDVFLLFGAVSVAIYAYYGSTAVDDRIATWASQMRVAYGNPRTEHGFRFVRKTRCLDGSPRHLPEPRWILRSAKSYSQPWSRWFPGDAVSTFHFGRLASTRGLRSCDDRGDRFWFHGHQSRWWRCWGAPHRHSPELLNRPQSRNAGSNRRHSLTFWICW